MSAAGVMPPQMAGPAGWNSYASAATKAIPKSAATSDRAAARYGWGKVVAGDEFSYKGPPNSLTWRVYNSPGHNGKGMRRASAWRVDGAMVTVTGDALGTVGGMASRYSQRYGRWEARMKTSVRDRKYHPVLLLWPDLPSPNCPEVNFAEGTNNTRLAKFFLHYGCHNIGRTRATKAVDMTKWHNYAVEWNRSGMTGYIDGVPFFRDVDPKHLPLVSMHACIQLDWFPDGKEATRRTTMNVDWIRVYRAS
jgi:licheninase